MNTRIAIILLLLVLGLGRPGLAGEQTQASTPQEVFSAALVKLAGLFDPGSDSAGQTLSMVVKLTRAKGLPDEMVGQTAELAFQAPNRLRVATTIGRSAYSLGRNDQELWIHAAAKKFGLVGKAGLARFAAEPDPKDTTRLGAIKLPLPKEQVLLLPLLMQLAALPPEQVDGVSCHVLTATPQPQALQVLPIPKGQWRLWFSQTDQLPRRISYAEGEKIEVEVELRQLMVEPAWPAEKWNLTTASGDRIHTVALSHLTRFLPAAWSILTQKLPSLGPATGERRLLAVEGQGRLEWVDGTKVLYLKGTPEDMGRQHGILMRKQVKDLVNRVLYGVGVGSSFTEGEWFVGRIESAQARIAPFVAERYLREMDALAQAAGIERQEARLSNFFPELFHCSGFALYGDATVGGRMFHGRILDYMKGIGLEQNAVVIVHQPDQGNAWVNISYAGFIGSVTAMNEKKVALGEMGGRGEGQWDGKPMAQLVREVMEKADTIDQALDIMRQGPRTCEYYYVISDGKSNRAVGIAATPDRFETIWAGQSHPRLPRPFKDVVLMSAGDRYDKLADRVRDGYGKFDADSARRLMDRPVAMTSNIHSALFAPDTLDFWVANADSANVASHTRYTHYNLADLLNGPPAQPQAAAAAK